MKTDTRYYRLPYGNTKPDVEAIYALMRQEGKKMFDGSGQPRPLACGKTAVCHNLREEEVTQRGAKGYSRRLKAVARPALLAEVGRTPVYSDVREGELYLFTQEDDGSIFVEARMDRRARHMDHMASFLGKVEEVVEGGAAVGDFLIFRLRGGSLVYSVYEREGHRYRWLGELPRLPRFIVETDSCLTKEVEMKGVSFKAPLTDLSGKVPDDVKARVTESMRQAWQKAADELLDAGYWIEPIEVRFAMRLWDGSLFNVSEPVRVTPPVRQGHTRVQAGLLWDSAKQGFTGTDSTTLAVQGYCIGVSVDGEMPQEWEGIVQGLEVWISKEPQTLDDDAYASMAFMHDHTGNYLSVLPPARAVADINAEVARMPTGMLDFYSLPETPELLFNSQWVSYTSKITGYVSPFPRDATSATCILGYGGFLHIGNKESVSTSLRGNPFVLQGYTDGVGGDVRSMLPQTVGGGAYTRQYIYVCTDRGIYALTLKANGTHSNCRQATPETLGPEGCRSATPSGVYVITDGGSLIRLKDSNANVVMKGLAGVRSLLWSHSYEELWLCGGDSDGSIVIQTRQGMRAHTRSETYQPIEGLYSPSLVCTADAQGVVSIHTPEWEEDNPYEYVAYAADLSLEHTGSRPCLDLRLEECEVDFRFEATAKGGGNLIKGSAYGPGCYQVMIPLMLPSGWPEQSPELRGMRFSLEGKVEGVEGLRVC